MLCSVCSYIKLSKNTFWYKQEAALWPNVVINLYQKMTTVNGDRIEYREVVSIEMQHDTVRNSESMVQVWLKSSEWKNWVNVLQIHLLRSNHLLVRKTNIWLAMLFPHSWMKDLIEILIHRRCNSHSSKSSTPEKIVNVLLEMAKMYHSYRVNNILIVSNICKRNVF